MKQARRDKRKTSMLPFGCEQSLDVGGAALLPTPALRQNNAKKGSYALHPKLADACNAYKPISAAPFSVAERHIMRLRNLIKSKRQQMEVRGSDHADAARCRSAFVG